MEGCLMKINSKIEIFVFALYVICLRIMGTTVNSFVATDLSLMLNHSLITVDVFVLVLPRIHCYIFYLVQSG